MFLYSCKCHDKPANHAHQDRAPQASLGTWVCDVNGKKCKVHRSHVSARSKSKEERFMEYAELSGSV